MIVCPEHKTPFKTIPAGVSKKTGKSYTAFQVCQTDGCKIKPEEGIEVEAFDLPAKQVLDEMPSPKETIMTKVDWNNKDFTEGLRALSYDVRKQDMHPVDAWDTTHLKEWMRAIYGDYEGYDEWEKKMEVRVSRIKHKPTKEEKLEEDVNELLGD